MITRDEAISEVMKLKDGESWTYPESYYGKAEIWLKNGTYFLFEIPTYGGEPSFNNYVNYAYKIDGLISIIEGWT